MLAIDTRLYCTQFVELFSLKMWQHSAMLAFPAISYLTIFWINIHAFTRMVRTLIQHIINHSINSYVSATQSYYGTMCCDIVNEVIGLFV